MLDEWFGGQKEGNMFTETDLDWVTASKNAYMLFYERSVSYKPREPDEGSLEIINLIQYSPQFNIITRFTSTIEVTEQMIQFTRIRLL